MDLEILCSKFSRNTELLDKKDIALQLIQEFIQEDYSTLKKFIKIKHKLFKKYKIQLKHYEILYFAKMINAPNEFIEQCRVKKMRSLSGILNITVVMTGKIFSCPKDCAYCPNEPNQPRSYLMKEPAVLRANQNDFDPVLQFQERGLCYLLQGHYDLDKIELNIKGGTFDFYPEEYKHDFITKLYYAANTFFDYEQRPCLSLEDEIKINETTKVKIIGLTIETRPDFITPTSLLQLRQFGVTRVELGVQHTDNNILEAIHRECTTEDTIRATRLLKEHGFKVDYHLMPNLPFSNPDEDMFMMKEIINCSDYKPDQIKIYPCETTEYTKIKDWYEKGIYTPYSNQELYQVILEFMKICPEWIRINRIRRDITNEYVYSGPPEHLHCIIDDIMKKEQIHTKDIRSREPKYNTFEYDQIQLLVTKYNASKGIEHFIRFETLDNQYILGFLRLFFPQHKQIAYIREVHVYGQMISTRQNIKKIQSIGLGKRMIQLAEQITKHHHIPIIKVIAGVGTREYYKKIGYTYTNDTYMTKKFQYNFITILLLFMLLLFILSLFIF